MTMTTKAKLFMNIHKDELSRVRSFNVPYFSAHARAHSTITVIMKYVLVQGSKKLKSKRFSKSKR